MLRVLSQPTSSVSAVLSSLEELRTLLTTTPLQRQAFLASHGSTALESLLWSALHMWFPSFTSVQRSLFHEVVAAFPPDMLVCVLAESITRLCFSLTDPERENTLDTVRSLAPNPAAVIVAVPEILTVLKQLERRGGFLSILRGDSALPTQSTHSLFSSLTAAPSMPPSMATPSSSTFSYITSDTLAGGFLGERVATALCSFPDRLANLYGAVKQKHTAYAPLSTTSLPNLPKAYTHKSFFRRIGKIVAILMERRQVSVTHSQGQSSVLAMVMGKACAQGHVAHVLPPALRKWLLNASMEMPKGCTAGGCSQHSGGEPQDCGIIHGKSSTGVGDGERGITTSHIVHLLSSVPERSMEGVCTFLLSHLSIISSHRSSLGHLLALLSQLHSSIVFLFCEKFIFMRWFREVRMAVGIITVIEALQKKDDVFTALSKVWGSKSVVETCSYEHQRHMTRLLILLVRSMTAEQLEEAMLPAMKNVPNFFQQSNTDLRAMGMTAAMIVCSKASPHHPLTLPVVTTEDVEELKTIASGDIDAVLCRDLRDGDVSRNGIYTRAVANLSDGGDNDGDDEDDDDDDDDKNNYNNNDNLAGDGPSSISPAGQGGMDRKDVLIQGPGETGETADNSKPFISDRLPAPPDFDDPDAPLFSNTFISAPPPSISTALSREDGVGKADGMKAEQNLSNMRRLGRKIEVIGGGDFTNGSFGKDSGGSQVETGNADNDDTDSLDDEEDLQPFSMPLPEEDRPPAEILSVPRYIRECLTVLGEAADGTKVTAALSVLSALARKQPTEVDEVGCALASVLVGLANDYALQNFEQQRREALATLCVSAPATVGPHMAREFYSQSWSQRQRLDICQALVDAALELSDDRDRPLLSRSSASSRPAPFPSSSPSSLPATGVSSSPKARNGTSLTTLSNLSLDTPAPLGVWVGKTRRFASATKRSQAAPNAFAKYAALWFVPLAHGLRESPRFLRNDQIVLGGLLRTLAVVVRCARGSATLQVLAGTLLEIATLLRSHDDSSVRCAALCALVTAALASNDAVKEALVDLQGLMLALQAATSEDPSPEGRELAKASLAALSRALDD